jgi:hypothetical protein
MAERGRTVRGELSAVTPAVAPLIVATSTTSKPTKRAAVAPKTAIDFDEQFVARISRLTLTKHLNGVAMTKDLPGRTLLGSPRVPAVQAQVGRRRTRQADGAGQ